MIVMEEEIRDKVAKLIKNERIRQKITQEDLAYKSNVSCRYLSDIENGKANFSFTTFLKVALALNLSALDLLQFYK